MRLILVGLMQVDNANILKILIFKLFNPTFAKYLNLGL